MLQRFKKIDGVIVVVLLMLMVISILSIYSVTHGRKDDGLHIQMIKWYGVGFVAFFGLSLFDYRLLVKYAHYIYIMGVGILVVVSFVGKVKNGAKGWLEVGGLSLQPAELFKLILILALAALLVRKNKDELLFWRDVVPLSLVALLPFAVVIIQNDLGNALSYMVILVGLLWIGRMKWSHALIGLIIFGGSIFGFIYSYINYHEQMTSFLSETIGRKHFVARFDPWLVPELASSDDSYQTRNAKIAIASGGLSGEGYMQGGSVQSGKIPVLYTDAIFAQIAEEFGFVGAALLLLLFFILIHRMIMIALECRERAGPFLIIGIVAMLLYQIFENIGAYIGLMPLTGITLPFISYGGTSIVINMASMGIAMSVLLYGQDVEEDLPAPAVYF
ncbi:FtsW/RodA/SpoVE family cell cycle protein [Paenibacillus sonchi]|uniref:FtsW/RodA/SpoVE family cell cycle protein n=1 Tax=Paenibacillus sonchi TaxID=373687 RepID=UPI001E37452B|nr:FtsW/RodA/SpoVE family cell cycle protein [Paenibacillus sonchi]MCE3203729.1 FtsW/RodA/SpoVE family cell cycle protein [Paenibacillus sonchi]